LEIVRAALRADDPAALEAVLAPDARWYGSRGGGGCRSREEVLQTLRDVYATGLRIALKQAALTGPCLVLHLALSGGERDDRDGRREGWFVFDLDDGGAITQIAEYSSAQSVAHDLALRFDGATASGPATPPVVSALVPFVHVGDVERSVGFYRHLGFAPVDTFEPGGVLHWASLRSERAAIMLASAGEPIEHRAQAVLFYLYTDDLAGLRDRLVVAGLAPGEIVDGTPGPTQEMRVADPDGYVLMIAQIEADE
jgi:hypothetical protein